MPVSRLPFDQRQAGAHGLASPCGDEGAVPVYRPDVSDFSDYRINTTVVVV